MSIDRFDLDVRFLPPRVSAITGGQCEPQQRFIYKPDTGSSRLSTCVRFRLPSMVSNALSGEVIGGYPSVN